jgi:hypothetical protein
MPPIGQVISPTPNHSNAAAAIATDAASRTVAATAPAATTGTAVAASATYRAAACSHRPTPAATNRPKCRSEDHQAYATRESIRRRCAATDAAGNTISSRNIENG